MAGGSEFPNYVTGRLAALGLGPHHPIFNTVVDGLMARRQSRQLASGAIVMEALHQVPVQEQPSVVIQLADFLVSENLPQNATNRDYENGVAATIRAMVDSFPVDERERLLTAIGAELLGSKLK